MLVDFITVEQSFPYAEPGTAISLDSSIARPFRVLIEKGLDTGRVNHLFFFDSGHFSVVGSLCYTSTGRLIFFPGVIGRKTLWDSEKGDLKEGGVVDHLTLEPNSKSWHLTIHRDGKKDKSSQLPSRRTFQVEPGLDYWFGMSVASSSVFEKQFQNYLFSFPVHSGVSSKYLKILEQSKKDSKFHSMSLVHEGIESGEFLHFDFLIDNRKNKEETPKNIVSVPYGPPALVNPLELTGDFIIRAHPVEIPTFPGNILVLVSKHVGELTNEVIFGSAPEPIDLI